MWPPWKTGGLAGRIDSVRLTPDMMLSKLAVAALPGVAPLGTTMAARSGATSADAKR